MIGWISLYISIFRLDQQLYHDCKDDAKKICHANEWGDQKETSLPDNFVISCLYRNALLHESDQLRVRLTRLLFVSNVIVLIQERFS